MFSDQSPMKIPPPRRDEIAPVTKGDEVEKPKRPPANVRKEFKEVLDGENEAVSEEEFERAAKKLAGHKHPKGFIKAEGQSKPMSLFDLSREVSAHKEPPKDIADLSIDEQASGAFTDVDPLAKKTKFNTHFTQEQTDLSFINPANTQVQPIETSASVQVERTGMHISPIQDIVEKLIDKLFILETKGQTDTTLTLGEGVFKGTVIVISQFHSANGQLNLAFENLTQQAKALMDAQPNRDQLMLALSEKGYTVQQFTTTTILEHKPVDIPETGAQFSRPREKEEERNPNRCYDD
jgi:hypothetical protein